MHANDSNVKNILNRINSIKYDDNMSNVLCKKRSIEFKELKRDLRRIQRYKLFNNCKTEALNLEECLSDHKDKFWIKINIFSTKLYTQRYFYIHRRKKIIKQFNLS